MKLNVKGDPCVQLNYIGIIQLTCSSNYSIWFVNNWKGLLSDDLRITIITSWFDVAIANWLKLVLFTYLFFFVCEDSVASFLAHYLLLLIFWVAQNVLFHIKFSFLTTMMYNFSKHFYVSVFEKLIKIQRSIFYLRIVLHLRLPFEFRSIVLIFSS